ncbi:MAG: hypothetical protein PHS14_12155 [Elusimicrobia bacterium]|nr:hypothetical protein [Elusimicrobiota bacterium]
MQKITRGRGITPSERYLATLADKTFLKLWSYANLFYDKRTAVGGSGKEFCDLLAVCGDDIFIFSDKNISWPGKAPELSWRRWYRRAIENSVAQIRGADRWLRDFPERIFIDPDCTRGIPIELPPKDKRRVHGIAVAIGSSKACAEHFGGRSGTFPVVPHLKGSQHYLLEGDGASPFGIGDVNPGGPFIHVFDDYALNLVMRELDTVSDFAQYLIRRERLIRSERLLAAPGEEELLGYYMQHLDSNQEHDFVKPDGTQWAAGEFFTISDGMHERLLSRPEYVGKKSADRISYVWDQLIDEFSRNLLAGTSVPLFGEAVDIKDAEQGLRSMARENRTYRRLLGEALMGSMAGREQTQQDRFCRVIMPGYESPNREFAYVFLVMPYPAHLELKGGYDQYRKVRANMLHAYCLNVLCDNRKLKRIIGIALDGPSKETAAGTSEDMLTMEAPEWTPAAEKEAHVLRQKFDILKSGRLKFSHVSASEYPGAGAKTSESRQQRRARERSDAKAARKNIRS